MDKNLFVAVNEWHFKKKSIYKIYKILDYNKSININLPFMLHLKCHPEPRVVT